MVKVGPFISITRFLIIAVRLHLVPPSVVHEPEYGDHREFARNAASHAPAQTSWVRMCFWTRRSVCRRQYGKLCSPRQHWFSPSACFRITWREGTTGTAPDISTQLLWHSCFDPEFAKSWNKPSLIMKQNSSVQLIISLSLSLKLTLSLSLSWSSEGDGVRPVYRWKGESGLLLGIKLGKNWKPYRFYILVWPFLCTIRDPPSPKSCHPGFHTHNQQEVFFKLCK